MEINKLAYASHFCGAKIVHNLVYYQPRGLFNICVMSVSVFINWLRLSWPVLRIILFSGLDYHGQLLRKVLDVLPPSVCGILRSDPSDTLQHRGREEGSWTPTLPIPLSLKSVFYLLAAGLLLFLLLVLEEVEGGLQGQPNQQG